MTDFVTSQGAVPSIQLAHSGRKGSVSRPWEGTKPLTREQGGWEVFGPSAVSHGDDRPPPRVMDRALIDEVIDAYAAAARRSREAGFRLIELHAAHGYLIHSFLSPLSNRREDEYGGSLQNRARMLMRAIAAIRAEWPADLPLGVRLSFSDWVEGRFEPDEAVEVCRMLKASGEVDYVACSSGGTSPLQKVPASPGYQVPFAERARREGGIPSVAVGLVSAPEQAEEILANGRADLVALGRILLYEPHWPLHAAKVLKAASVAWPVQYERANIF
jgi:2,4-dienoyl-CoA reductase-like NADH-dependent reductase (Old Yellow Enzyme family)